MLNGLSKQRGYLIGSPKALYEEGVVQPLVFTILPPSQISWWDHFDNIGTLGGILGHIMFTEANIK